MWVRNAIEGGASAIFPLWRKNVKVALAMTVDEGRFRNDAIDGGQGTMKMERTMAVHLQDGTNKQQHVEEVENQADKLSTLPSPSQIERHRPDKHDFMTPIWYQSDMTHIHAVGQKRGRAPTCSDFLTCFLGDQKPSRCRPLSSSLVVFQLIVPVSVSGDYLSCRRVVTY
jgi:hypothetical protein